MRSGCVAAIGCEKFCEVVSVKVFGYCSAPPVFAMPPSPILCGGMYSVVIYAHFMHYEASSLLGSCTIHAQFGNATWWCSWFCTGLFVAEEVCLHRTCCCRLRPAARLALHAAYFVCTHQWDCSLQVTGLVQQTRTQYAPGSLCGAKKQSQQAFGTAEMYLCWMVTAPPLCRVPATRHVCIRITQHTRNLCMLRRFTLVYSVAVLAFGHSAQLRYATAVFGHV